jgi:hypothetical protein
MPLIWKMGSDERALSTLEKMSTPDLATDWGTRILSSKSPLYEPLNYNYGAVWPFLTGYTATALYNYNCLIPAHQLIRAAAGFMFDNTLGQPTELFSGSLHVWPQEAVAHQGFSAGGFVLPFVRGLLGIQGNAVQKRLVFAPRFPADWPEVSVENIRVGPENFALRYDRKKTKILLIVDSRPGTEFRFNFAPVLGPGTRIVRGAVNGKSVEIETSDTPRCVQPSLEFNLTGRDVIEVEFEPTVEILPLAVESRVGDIDNGLKIVSQQLTGKSLNIVVYGLAGERYSLRLQNSDLAEAATGAEIRGDQLIIQMLPGKAGEFERQEVSLQIR